MANRRIIYAPLAPFNIIFCIINLMSKNATSGFTVPKHSSTGRSSDSYPCRFFIGIVSVF